MRRIILILLLAMLGCGKPNDATVKEAAWDIFMEDPANHNYENPRKAFEELWQFHLGYRNSILGHDTVMWEWEKKARRRLLFRIAPTNL